MNAALKEAIRALLPRRIGTHRIQGGPIRGARIRTSWHDYPGAILGTTETPLLGWFARHVNAGETWLDIGAHYGYTSIALSNLVGISGRVFAFEPVAATAACITQTRELNQLSQLRIVPVGLSRDRETRGQYLPVFRGMAESVGANMALRQLITTVSLDSLWGSLCGDNPAVHGVKIDVQGMEGDVLWGMQKILCRWQPTLIVEFHRGVDRHRIVDLIGNCGYDKRAIPIESGPDRIEDDQSYAFYRKAR